MTDSNSAARRIHGWLLVFLYFFFVYAYGAKLSTLIYTDFASLYYGAKLAFHDRQSPYDAAALTAAARRAEPPKLFEPPAKIYPYLYPPPSLLMFYPLAKLPPAHAKIALLAANHVCLLAIIWMLLIPIGGFKPHELLEPLPVFLIVYIFLSKGTLNTIELGQVNLIVLALLCLTWWGCKREWPEPAIAIPLALACMFKIYPIVFLALLLVRRKWISAATTCLLLVAFCAAAWFALPRSLWHQWMHDVLSSSGYLKNPLGVFPPTFAGNIGIAGFMSRLFLPPELFRDETHVGRALIGNQVNLGRLVTYGLVAFVSLMTVLAAFIGEKKESARAGASGRRFDLMFAAFLILTFLVAPLAWEHHLAYVTPAAVIVLILALRDRTESTGNWMATLVLLIACVLGWPMTIGRLPLPRIPQILLVSLKLYAVLALWFYVLTQIVATDRAEVASA